MQETSYFMEENLKMVEKMHREFFTAPTFEEITKKMDDRLDKLKPQGHTLVRRVLKIGRNQPCPCGSGKKFKKCCIEKVMG